MAPNPISPIVVGMGAQLVPISRSPAAPFCIWLRSVSAKEHVELIVNTVHATPCILFSVLPVSFILSIYAQLVVGILYIDP